MRYFVILKVAFRALRRNKLRTVLTMLGIIIGVGAVIAMVALGRGAKSAVQARIAALGQSKMRWPLRKKSPGRSRSVRRRGSAAKSWWEITIGIPKAEARAWITC